MWSLLLLAAALGRPMLPTLPEVPPEAVCNDPAARAAFLASPPRDLAEEYMNRMMAYLDLRMDALGMTKEEQAALALRVMKSPEFIAAMTKGMAAAVSALDDAREIMRLKNEIARCRKAIRSLTRMPAMLASAEEQWSVLERAIDVEAARRRQSAQ